MAFLQTFSAPLLAQKITTKSSHKVLFSDPESDLKDELRRICDDSFVSGVSNDFRVNDLKKLAKQISD